MFKGIVFSADRWEMTATMGCSCSSTDFTAVGGIARGGIETDECPTNVTREMGISISLSAERDPIYPAGTSVVRVQIPELSLDMSVTQTGFVSGQTGTVAFNGLKLYQSSGGWELSWISLEIWINGSMTAGPGPASVTSSRLAPSGVPLIGIGANLSGGASPNPVLVVGVPPAFTFAQDNHVSVGCNVTGGWRYRETPTGAWIAPPVNLNVLGVPGGSCDATSTPATVSASNTYNGSVSSSCFQQVQTIDEGTYTCYCDPDDHSIGIPSITHVYQTTATLQSNSGNVYLWPDLTKGVRRFGPTDYAAWIDRGGMPLAPAAASHSCYDGTLVEPPPPTVVTADRYPRLAKASARVTNLTNAIEAPFSRPTYAPYFTGGYGQVGKSTGTVIIQVGACPLTGGGGGEDEGGGSTAPTVCFPVFSKLTISQSDSQFPQDVDTSSDNGDLLSYLYHLDSIARLMDYPSCPHWSYRYHFPPDRTGALQPDDWPLYGSQAQPSLYWLPMRSQWFSSSDPALVSGDRTGSRTDLISAPLVFGQLAASCGAFFGQETSWWGISRFQAQNRLPLASLALDSTTSGRWGFTGCTASFGSSIVLTPTSTTITAAFLLSSTSSAPWVLLELIDRISASWTGSTIVSSKVSLIGSDGAERVILTSTGSFSWQQASQEIEYAGSWGQAFGVGFDGSDQGTDVPSGGFSSAEMSAAETAYALELLPGGTAKFLRFLFVLSGTSSTVSLSYPSFTTRQDRPVVMPETGQFFTALYSKGPGVRFGQWTFWDPSGGGSWVGPTPNLSLLGGGWSVLDWLGSRRLALDGKAPDDGLDAELATLYDSSEGQTRAAAAVGTSAFVVVSAVGRLTGILVNSQSEVPPLCCFPFNDRNAEWQRLPGTFKQLAWSHASEPRYLIKGGGLPADVVSGGGSVWTAVGGPSVPGWSIHRHSHAVDNTEGASFQVQAAGIEFATVTPWHGYSCCLSLATQGMSYDVNAPLRHMVGFSVDGSDHIVLGFAGNVLPQSWSYVDTGLVGKWVRGRFQDHGRPSTIGLFYGNAVSSCKYSWSEDGGVAWGTVDMAAGVIGDFEEGANGCRWFFKVLSSDGGATFDVWTKLLDSQRNVLFDWTLTNLVGVDHAPIACRESPASDGSWRIGVWYSVGGSPAVAFAQDGLSFS